ncbi:MAG: 30S ribosomal protein S12 methylthiotransferase RimO [Tissierellia bacterium]|nr:30S ribosomal protein S12 methylthiotransferase RimO [Tissierellia bacterium]
MNRVHFVTLGCSKNEVDSSIMQSVLNKDQFLIEKNPHHADIIIINTCGFIQSAKEESIDTIFEASLYKERGQCKKLLLAGCLAQRYSKELMEEIPEIDGIIGTGNLKDLNAILMDVLENQRVVKADNINDDYLEGYERLNVQVTEYVKISEGCNNHCSYCIIPQLRGRNRSRKIEDIVDEIQYLVANGAREIILIGQNTTDYGIDLYGEYRLADLISEISRIEKLKWIRVLYLYPDHFNDLLIDEFKNNDKLLKYVDIPLQHVSNRVLKGMNRHTDQNHIKNLMHRLRSEIKDIVIRTTFIVGFPGEEESDFRELMDFIKKYPFDKIGVFPYSREEGTKAYEMKEQVPETIKTQRIQSIMKMQSSISKELLEQNIGKVLEILIEEKVAPNEYIGRSVMDAPEIDGITYVHSQKDIQTGDFIPVEIMDALEYDLIGDAL